MSNIFDLIQECTELDTAKSLAKLLEHKMWGLYHKHEENCKWDPYESGFCDAIYVCLGLENE